MTKTENIKTGYRKFYADGSITGGDKVITQPKGTLLRDMEHMFRSLPTTLSPTHMIIPAYIQKKMAALK